MSWTRTTVGIATKDGRRAVHAWADGEAGIVLSSACDAEGPPPSRSGALMLTHRESGCGLLDRPMPVAYCARVLPLLRALPIGWAGTAEEVRADFERLADEQRAILAEIGAGKSPEPPVDAWDLPVGRLDIAALRLPAWKTGQRVRVLDEAVKVDGGGPLPEGFRCLRAYLALCREGTIEATVEAGRWVARITLPTGGATFGLPLGLSKGTEAAARALLETPNTVVAAVPVPVPAPPPASAVVRAPAAPDLVERRRAAALKAVATRRARAGNAPEARAPVAGVGRDEARHRAAVKAWETRRARRAA